MRADIWYYNNRRGVLKAILSPVPHFTKEKTNIPRAEQVYPRSRRGFVVEPGLE